MRLWLRQVGVQVIIAVVSSSLSGRMGDAVDDVSAGSIRKVLAELDEPEDPEHPDVFISHSSGWCLSAFQSGLLVWENDEDEAGGPFHMRGVSRSVAEGLFRAVAGDDLDAVRGQPWLPGYS